MEEWSADRAQLRLAVRDHPEWSVPQLAQRIGRSVSWVKKWRRRLRAAPPDDETVLASQPRARQHPPPSLSQLAIERILAIRDAPPAHLQRVPGPRAILYFLQQDAELQAAGIAPPRSTATVWRVLRRQGRIPPRRRPAHEPVDLPPPLTSWQLDVQDVSTVPSDPEGKRQHGVEALNCVDCGSSLLVAAEVRADFTEETTLAAIAELLQAYGRPLEITLDRDPLPDLPGRGGAGQPTPSTRFERVCGAVPRVVRPRVSQSASADHAGAGPRGHRRLPGALQHRAAQPGTELPPCPPLPMLVDPDAWLRLVDGRRYVRQVQADGSVTIEHARYYVGRRLAGQRVAVAVTAAERALVVHHGDRLLKRLPLRGVRGEVLPLDRYVELMEREARAAARRRRRRAA